MVNNGKIKRLVAKSETAAVEVKRARSGVTTDFWPSYSAFANTDGGTSVAKLIWEELKESLSLNAKGA